MNKSEDTMIRVFPDCNPFLLKNISSDYPFSRNNLCPEYSMRVFSKLCREYRRHFTLWNNLELIGVVSLSQIQEKKWGIWNTYIEPSFRGKGFSKEIYNKAIKYLANIGGNLAITTVALSNEISLKSIRSCFEGFYDVGFDEIIVNYTQMEPNLVRLSDYEISVNQTILHSLTKMHRNAMGELWYHQWGEDCIDPLHDFRNPPISFPLRYLMKKNIYCNPEEIEEGYLVINRWMNSKAGFGLFVPGLNEASSVFWNENLWNILSSLYRDFRYIRLIVLESPRTARIEVNIGERIHHKIAYTCLE